MTKEQEIIKSFLMSNFHWVEVGRDGVGKFNGYVCPIGTTWSSEWEKKCLKKSKNQSDWSEWLPDSALKSLESFNIDVTGEDRQYSRYSKEIGSEMLLVIEITSGSISGVFTIFILMMITILTNCLLYFF